MGELRVERVLRAVECIPLGRAAAYSEIGRAVGASPRFVARVLSSVGSTVSWWRVPNVRGALPAPLTARALPHWQEEEMPLTHDKRIDMPRARVETADFDLCVRDALADLPSAGSDGAPD